MVRGFTKLKNLMFAEKGESAPKLPENIRVYCIGDIHGRDDLLAEILNKITDDASTFTGRALVIFLGDYIDRGENSREVLEILLNQSIPGFEYVYLRGNHEQTLLDFLQEATVAQSWVMYGGQATLASYGVKVTSILFKRNEFIRIQRELLANLPEAHRQFIANTVLSYSIGSYFFVHAGIKPKVPLALQRVEDMLWIRDEFLSSKKQFKKCIVHGHSISSEVEMLPNRIGIDTGAYSSGILTCLVLQEDQRRLLQTGGCNDD